MSERHLLSAATLLATTAALLAAASFTAFAQPAERSISTKAIEPASRAAAAASLKQSAARTGAVRVIVGLKRTLRAPHDLSPVGAQAQTQALRAAQSAVVSRVTGGTLRDPTVVAFDYIPFLSMIVTAAQVDRLAADPEIATLHEDVPSDPHLAESVPMIKANLVANAGFPGNGYTIAVLDTGVNKTHDMFAGAKVVSEACYSSNVPLESKTVCPGGVQATTAANSGVDCPQHIHGCYHGTHVAGIAAGNMEAPLLRGVAPNAQIIAIQVFSHFTESGSARSWPTDYIKGLERVYALRNTFAIAAVNMSLGGGAFNGPCDKSNPATAAIITLLRNARIATVIASGNNGITGALGAPACHSNAIAVGATLDTENTLADYSNHAEMVRVLAPGSDIVSAAPDTTPPLNARTKRNGTSMAAPHVAGAFALLRDARPSATIDDIAAALECTGVKVTRSGIAERRIDVNAALAYLKAPPAATRTFTFGSAADAAEWAQHAGIWKVASGKYQLARHRSGYNASSTVSCDATQTITAVLRRNWAARTQGRSGMFFKAQYSPISATEKRLSGYFVFLERDLSGSDVANLTFLRLDRFNLITGFASGNELLCSKDIDTITRGLHYTIKVVTKGGRHRVFLNNVLQCDVTERSYGTGRTGVIADFPSPGGAGDAFDVETFIIDPTAAIVPIR